MYKITIDYGDEEHCYICNSYGWQTNYILWIRKGEYEDYTSYVPLFKVRSVSVTTLSKDESEKMYIVARGEINED